MKLEFISQKQALVALRVLYPVWLVVGIFGIVYVPSVLVVSGDAVKTADNLQLHESLFRAGIAANLLEQLLFIFAVLLLYKLFSLVNKNLATLMIVLAMVSVPIAMLNELNNIAALAFVHNPPQMMLFIDLQKQGINIASIFWGLWLFPLGLIVKNSGYFPKAVGWAVILAGIGYTFGSFLKILTPGLAVILPILEIMTFGEVIFLIWLVVKGAKIPNKQ